MTMWQWVQKQWSKLDVNGGGLLRRGQWYVRYNDGRRSKMMTYDVCRDYAEIFGGKAYHKFDKEEGR